MSTVTSFDLDDAKLLLNQLVQWRQVLRIEWQAVSGQWGNLSMAWHDTQRDKFEPYYTKLLSDWNMTETNLDSAIVFLTEQIRIAEERQSRLGAL